MEENIEKADKVSFADEKLKVVPKSILGKMILLKPVIDWNTQQVLILSYLERMFGEYDNPFGKFVDTNRFLAETAFRSDFIKMMTDIDVDSLPEEYLLNDESFFDLLTSDVENFSSFKDLLNEIVQDVKDKKSFGNVLDYLFNETMKLAGSLDENYFENIAKQIENLGKSIENSNLSGLMDESAKAPKKSRSKKE